MKDKRSRDFVSRAEEQQARAVVHEFLAREAGPYDSAARADSHSDQTEADAPSVTVIGKIIAIAGVTCALGGIAQSTLAYISARRYSEKALAYPLLDDDWRRSPGVSGPQTVGYSYRVNEEVFVIRPRRGKFRSAEFVRYDRRDPSEHVLGEIISPPYWFFGGMLIGGMLLFVAWQFGRPPTPEEGRELACLSEEPQVGPL